MTKQEKETVRILKKKLSEMRDYRQRIWMHLHGDCPVDERIRELEEKIEAITHEEAKHKEYMDMVAEEEGWEI